MALHHEPQSDKSPAELRDRVWALMEQIKFCMLASWDGTRQRMRPLTAMPDKDRDMICFLVDADSEKTWQIEHFGNVTLGFASPGKDDYLALFGHATITDDRARIKELWTPFAKAWWDSPDDPAIRLLTVHPEEAEIWQGPNRLVAGAIMLGAAMTGKRPGIGDHGHVRM
jgi:general stress protein 26